MAIINYEDVTPTLIPNTTMKKMFIDGVHKVYVIGAVDGYVLHDNRLDYELTDEITLEPIGIELGYAEGTITVRTDYDFTAVVQDTITDINGNSIVVNKIGEYELYAISRDSLPEHSYISGGGDNDHEVMAAKEAPKND